MLTEQSACQQTEKKTEHQMTSDSRNGLQTASSYEMGKGTCHNFPSMAQLLPVGLGFEALRLLSDAPQFGRTPLYD
jgi:hypothetical protein